MQVVGLCRFSYPAEGGFQIEHASRSQREAFLYAPDRMEERFRHFECVCLPSIRGQTDPDFIFLILVGESLPTRFRQRLDALVADVPQVRVVSRPPGPHRDVCQEILNEVRGEEVLSLQFRLDDDDAVALTFVEKLKSTAEMMEPLILRSKLVALDWNRGHIQRLGPGGIEAKPAVIPFSSAALAVAVRYDSPLSVMNFAHNRINQFMPTVSFTRPPMFVRSHSDSNDSRQKSGIQPEKLVPLDAEGEADFRSQFGIDADQVRRVFRG